MMRSPLFGTVAAGRRSRDRRRPAWPGTGASLLVGGLLYLMVYLMARLRRLSFQSGSPRTALVPLDYKVEAGLDIGLHWHDAISSVWKGASEAAVTRPEPRLALLQGALALG